MYLRWLFYAFAILNVIVGLSQLIAPEATVAMLGTRLDAIGVTLSRYWAAAAIPIGYIAWMAAAAPASALKLHLVRAFALAGLLEVVATAFGISAGAVTTAGALPNLVVGVVFALGFAAYGWMRPEAA